MDEADRAAAQEEKHLEASLSHRKPVPERTGFCLNCGDPAEGAFCCRGCGEDYEARERINK